MTFTILDGTEAKAYMNRGKPTNKAAFPELGLDGDYIPIGQKSGGVGKELVNEPLSYRLKYHYRDK